MARPRTWDNIDDLENAIEDYFNSNNGKITITGLALHLGFESRQSVYDYEKDGAFSYTIKKARLRVENFYELELLGDHTSGAIFALKNFGWSDKKEIDHTTKGESINKPDLTKLSDDELRKLAELQSKSGISQT